jgi:hypothetical protein
MDNAKCTNFSSQGNAMFSTIEGERVSANKACLYKTAVVSSRMSDILLQHQDYFQGLSGGTCVAV